MGRVSPTWDRTFNSLAKRDRSVKTHLFPREKDVELRTCPRVGWLLGYSDFHNLMGFTSKKMPNNILKNVCKKVF